MQTTAGERKIDFAGNGIYPTFAQIKEVIEGNGSVPFFNLMNSPRSWRMKQ